MPSWGRRMLAYRWSVFFLAAAGLCALMLGLSAQANMGGAMLDIVTMSQAAPAASGPLSGKVIAVDAGHGGYDGGAVGRGTRVIEKDLNLDVALRLRDKLMSLGARVVLTRDGDYALCDEKPNMRKKLQDMQRRALLITQGGAEMVLSIHMNEYPKRSQRGPQVFYREGCDAGRLLSGVLQQALNAGLTPPKDRQAQAGDYYILTLGIPSALVECGFLSNAEEEKLLLDEQYRQHIADAVAQGVVDWYALPGPLPEPLPLRQR